MNTTITRSLLGAIILTFSILWHPIKATESTLAGIHCPGDVWVDCTEELWDLSIYGNAYFATYTGTISAGTPTVHYDLNSCNVGTITRTWSIYMYNAHHSCTQTIYVNANGSFTENNITWPTAEVELTGCSPSVAPADLPYGANQPTYYAGGCSLIAVSYTDMHFNFGSTCEKVLRTWKILDWCQYSPNTGSNAGLYTFVQIIKINKGEEPQTLCPAEITSSAYNCKDAIVNVAPLDLGPNGCGGGYDITNDSPYATSSGADISGIYPVGTTPVRYTINYACGLKKYCYTNIVVSDDSSPHVYCIGQIIIPLMGIDNDDDGINDEGMAQIWAKDFDYGSYSPCGHGPLTFSFSPDEVVMSQTFTCDHVGINNINIYMTDAIGNQAFCEVELNIQNNNANIQNCEAEDVDNPDTYVPSARLIGRISDAFDNSLASISVKNSMTMMDTIILESIDTTLTLISDSLLNASGTWLFYEIEDTVFTTKIDTILLPLNEDTMITTDADGIFSFDEVAMHMDYTIEPMYDSFYAREAITYDDVWLLLYHVLGYNQITEPLEIIAADIDGNGSITRDDLMILLDYVKGEIDEFPAGNNWVIIDKNYIEKVGYDALLEMNEYKSYIHLNELEDNHTDLDFLAIQIGNITNISNNKIKSDQMNTMLEQLEDPAAVLMDSPLQIVNRRDINIENVQAYPNPFKDQFQISILNESPQFADVKLLDISGKSWISKKIFLDQGYQIIQMDANVNLPGGMYLYQVQLGSQVIQGRLVKN